MRLSSFAKKTRLRMVHPQAGSQPCIESGGVN